METYPIGAKSVWDPISTDRFMLGAAHYPEHVDESYWERDAERMAAAGFNTVRLGEFAWHIFEPREGVFDFDLFDRAIEVLARHGIDTIMCTPTATPPRWLTMNYPEVLRVDEQGRTASHGSRQHADTASPVFRDHSRRITRAMADHYRDNKAVIGWQTDNELNTTSPTSYSAASRRAFQVYLEHRYDGDIGMLNHAWGGDFWATAYDNFDQIVLPIADAPGHCSPGHVQDYHRFLAAATTAFQKDQIDILRAANKDWFVFHNIGRQDDIDFRGSFCEDLDFMGYDVYPALFDELRRSGGMGLSQAHYLDKSRAYAGNFIVPEQQSGSGGQPPFATLNPEPGEMRRMAWSSVARGADGILFFRWRPAHFGAEIYWNGVMDHDDVPRRRYHEAKAFATECAALKDKILGTHVRMDVGIASADFDNQEAHKTFSMGMPSPEQDGAVMHRHCYRNGISCGYIHLDDDLSRLKVLYVPHWPIWDTRWTKRLHEFAEGGGTVIVSSQTGTRDRNNHVLRTVRPGEGLSELVGVQVEEFGRLAGPDAEALFFGWSDSSDPVLPLPTESSERRYNFKVGNQEYTAAHTYELLEVGQDVDVLGSWSNRFAEGRAMLTRRKVGRGAVCYVGTHLTDELAARLLEQDLLATQVMPLVPNLPQGVEVSMRQGEDYDLLFLMNLTADKIIVPGVFGALLVGQEDRTHEHGEVHLGPHGCAIVECAKGAGA
ncbi:beta-galactosidase [Halocynthiibacter sp. C4]|uniref:beta-galactosidase n=1 Tax=Halocynthiibacter sp. C4 TaxID=2992758 RepID=UPI00237A8470|nr:beta-galactosidase [Halocynthiibacter sp. C4]MDE0589685.1 beta-galactosidase [Halocynthiibacter sp. C4]